MGKIVDAKGETLKEEKDYLIPDIKDKTKMWDLRDEFQSAIVSLDSMLTMMMILPDELTKHCSKANLRAVEKELNKPIAEIMENTWANGEFIRNILLRIVEARAIAGS